MQAPMDEVLEGFRPADTAQAGSEILLMMRIPPDCIDIHMYIYTPMILRIVVA